MVCLREAREAAFENRKVARNGGDPLQARRAAKKNVPEFADAAKEVIELLSSGWTNPKSKGQWEFTLKRYAYPHLGRMRIDAIRPGDVLNVLTPIWGTKRETASRIRQRISTVMRWAIAHGYRTDDPAGEAVLQVLPRNREAVRHHKAVPYNEVKSAIATIQASETAMSTKLAAEFLILTAARSGEVRFATWNEIDLEENLWTVPPERMKTRRAHRIPLSDRCIELLNAAARLPSDTELVFPVLRGRAMSDSTISKLMRDLNIQGVPHGSRSSFRDWASENTSALHAVMEAALAHVIPNAAEAAYALSDLLEARRELMNAWAEFLA